jgi:two-component system KDP operon response regulator KdpE
MTTVLILDADPVSRRRTISAIRYGSFDAKIARNLRGAQQLLRRNRYAALIVDPGEGSAAAQTIEKLRAQTDTVIIVASESDDPPYKIALLDAGADDYLTLPFDPEELLARLRAVSRRVSQPDDARPIVTPGFTMHLADRRLIRIDKTEVPISAIEWRLIEVLAQHMGHLVTREELLASVWGPQAADKTNYLRVHMASIRRKIEPVPSRPRYFFTVPGLGLRFDPEGGAGRSSKPTRYVPQSAPRIAEAMRCST